MNISEKESLFQPGQPVSPDRFKGREDIIQDVLKYFPSVKTGHPQHFFIIGKKGIGKTYSITTEKSGKGNKVATLSLAIPRSFKNSEGVYDTDFIDCILFDNIADNTSEYCKKGDIVGIKGRVQSRVVEKDDKKEYCTDIIAEKVTFLSSKKED